MSEILVGYEVSDDPRRAGRAVSIPLKHMAVLGQTQESGKTTTQEAIITRSNLRAIAFLTKRGEQSFRLSKPIPAFFREASQKEYWRYVVSILEGMLEVKLGMMERGLILKLCREYTREGTNKKKPTGYSWKKPRTLHELRGNLEVALPHLRGNAEMICMQLAAYLDIAIPEIDKMRFADKLKIAPGINVMDITGMSTTLQSLVIRSVIEWVHERERNTIVIIPEAWKFIPQGRNTPVKMAAEKLIREGAAIRNFVWIDSQDLRGMDKMLLRSVGVWLFGVQREKNEVANTLDSIPDLPKPNAGDIMRLGKGQFFVAYGNQCIKTYVRPAGMGAEHAEAIARGEESAESWKQIVRQLDEQETNNPADQGEDSVDQSERPGDRAADFEVAVDSTEQRGSADAGAVGTLQGSAEDAPTWPPHKCEACRKEIPEGTAFCEECEDIMMYKEKYEALKIEFDQLRESHDAMAARLEQVIHGSPSREDAAPNAAENGGRHPTGSSPIVSDPRLIARDLRDSGAVGIGHNGVPSLRDIYVYVRDRAAKEDPKTLRLLLDAPEIELRRERKIIAMDEHNLKGSIAILIADKFFDAGCEFADVRRELIRRGMLGTRAPNQQISQSLQSIVELGFLTKEMEGTYKAVPGMKINIVEAAK